MLTYLWPIVNCAACVLSRFNKRTSVSQSVSQSNDSWADKIRHRTYGTSGSAEFAPPTGVSIGSAVLAELVVMTNRHTDTYTYM